MLRFWLKWLGATILGFVGAFVAQFVAIEALTGGDGPEAWGIPFEVAFPLVLAASVTVMAALQWRVMRRLRPQVSGSWVPATTFGLLAGAFVVFIVLGEGTTSLLASLSWGLTHAFVVGLLVGTMQWLAIRAHDPNRRWIRTTVLGMLVAELVGNTVGWYVDGAVGIVLLFVLWQAFTAPMLYRLLTADASRDGHRGLEPATVEE